MKRNLTIQLDEETVRKARLLAAKREKSVSRLVADEIRRLVREDTEYQKAKATAFAQLERGFDLGANDLSDRDSLHDR